MYSILIICVIAAASAAPYYGHHHGNLQDPGFFRHGLRRSPPPYPGFGEDIFDARTFWEEFANEMKQMDDILRSFYQHFPSSVSREGIEGDQYKIVIPLSGYKEEEIAVKARTGVLMIQAVHKSDEGHQRSYLDVRTLPECVELSGTWSYDKDVLTIQFPVKKCGDPTENPVTQLPEAEVPQTEAPDHSREEMGKDDNDSNLDADVGNKGDNNSQDKEVETNEIPDKRESIEATTYAVDLKDEVEFVPVSY